MTLVAAAVGAGSPATAQTGSVDDEAARQLAERYAPIVMLKEQDEPCGSSGEPFAPMPVDIVLDNPQVALRQVGNDDPVVMWGPGVADIAGLGEGFYLDFPGSALSPGCIFERDFGRFTDGVTPTVYAHVVIDPADADHVYLQYWMFWYFNDWNDKHEGDWEGITFQFEAATFADALAGEPLAVGFSQHVGGERARWGDPKLERDGDRPVVYPSAGSHASYFSSALYLGRSGAEGFGCDDTTAPSVRVSPDVILLPDSVDDPDDPLAWLSFDGRWGERQRGSFNGPTGPAAKERYLQPAEWFDGLRPSSVVIPAGGSGAASVIDVFCGAVETGSGLLIRLTTSPLQLGIAVVALGLLVRFLVRRTSWDEVPIAPIDRRRRSGEILRASMRTYRESPAVFVLFGLVYLPAAVVTGLLSALLDLIPFVSGIRALAGQAAGTSIILAALAGSVAGLAAFVVVNATVAEYLSHDGRDLAAGTRALRSAWDSRRALADGFVRAYVIVFVLLASFVGAPWGIRQLVRYQFVPQAIMIDDEEGRGALARSTALVRGRWLHTAVFVAVVNGATGLLALVVSLLLLLVASGIPLWLFSALVSLVYALAVPLAAIAMTLLYGDALAERDASVPVREPVPA